MSVNIQVHKRNTQAYTNTLGFIKTHNSILCQNAEGTSEISLNYLRKGSFSSADYVFVVRPITRQTRSSSNVLGFALVQDRESHLYIDVVCAKGAGTALLRQIEEFGKSKRKLFVMLNALPAAISFYRRLGYVHSEGSCVEDPVIKSLAEAVNGMRFQSSNHAISNKRFSVLLRQLVALKLVSNKRCKSVPQCSSDGYTMTKCLV